MSTKFAFPTLALLFTGSLLAAQVASQKAQAPQGQVTDAAATKVEPGMPLEFHVTGLTKENQEKVQQGLTDLTSQVYVCSACNHEQALAGKCSACKVDLTAKRQPVLLEAKPSVEDGSIRLVPIAVRNLRYSDLEGALLKSSVQIDPAQFPLAGKSRLVLRNGTSENAKTIEKALMDSKLFDLVKARYDETSKEIHVAVHADATPPSHKEVASVIEALGTKAELTDVIWGPTSAPIKP